MLFGGHHHGFARLPTAFFRPTVRKSEPTVVFSEKDGHNGRMPVHHGLLMRTVLHPEHAHAVILRLDGECFGSTLTGSAELAWGRGAVDIIASLDF